MRLVYALVIVVLCAACAEEPEPGVVCSSGVPNVGTSESENMAPGHTCNDCHAYTNSGGDGLDAPIFAFAGTVYPTLHEPDDCAGGPITATDHAQVIVVSASGKKFTAPITRGGNFMLESVKLDFPITARVEYRGRVRWMIDPVTTAECNSCHTVDGAENALGRIRLP